MASCSSLSMSSLLVLHPNIFQEIPHDETITDIDTYEEIYDVYDDTPLCSSLRDEILESLTSCNIFETKTLKDDYYEQEEGSYILGCDTSKEDSLTYDMDGNDDYWNFIDNPTYENVIENPIHDMSSKGSVYSKICGSPIYDTSIEGSVPGKILVWKRSIQNIHMIIQSHIMQSHTKSIVMNTLRSSVVKS